MESLLAGAVVEVRSGGGWSALWWLVGWWVKQQEVSADR